MHAVDLECHPSAPCAFVRGMSVRAHWSSAQRLSLRYRVEGEVHRLRLPAPRPSAPTNDLWRQTCFETFVKHGDARAYLELNFSPSTEWAIYGFDDYRRGMQPLAPRRPPEIAARSGEGLLEIDVDADFEGLFTESAQTDGLRLGVAAVLEDRQGRLSYWALAHPSERPDFHHPDSFALFLSPPGAPA